VVSAEVARDLAGNDGAMWRKVVTAPGTRDVVDVGAKAYDITDVMRRFITTRDLTCTSPGCQVPTIDCDTDHVIPFPQGETTVDNLVATCRGCHRKKTPYVYGHKRQRTLRLYGPPAVPDDAAPPFWSTRTDQEPRPEEPAPALPAARKKSFALDNHLPRRCVNGV